MWSTIREGTGGHERKWELFFGGRQKWERHLIKGRNLKNFGHEGGGGVPLCPFHEWKTLLV